MIGLDRNNGETWEEHAHTSITIESFVQTSRILQKILNLKCNEAVSAWKKTSKILFFQLLGYTAPFAPGTRQRNTELENLKIWKEMMGEAERVVR